MKKYIFLFIFSIVAVGLQAQSQVNPQDLKLQKKSIEQRAKNQQTKISERNTAIALQKKQRAKEKVKHEQASEAMKAKRRAMSEEQRTALRKKEAQQRKLAMKNKQQEIKADKIKRDEAKAKHAERRVSILDREQRSKLKKTAPTKKQ